MQMTDEVKNKLAKYKKAEEYFKPKEKDSLNSGKPISDILVNNFNWSEGDIRKRFQIDIDDMNQSILRDKINFNETKISDLFIPGGSIYLNGEGIKSGFMNFLTKGLRALDSKAWQNFIKEGYKIIQSNGFENIKIEDMYDTWWLIKSFSTHEITVTSFSLNVTTRFPNTILSEPDYVSVKIPTEDDLSKFEDYEYGSSISNEDLMQQLNKTFLGN